jgi:hypothetical protein
MRLDEVYSNLTGQKFGAKLIELFGAGATPRDLMAALELDTVPSEEHCRAAPIDIGATSSKSERALVDRYGKPEEVAAAGVGLLAVLYSKWGGARNEFARNIGTKAGSNLWTGIVLPPLDQRFRPDLDWKSAVASL